MSLMDTFTQFFTNGTMREEATKVVVDGLWATGEAALEAAQQNAYGLAIGTTVAVGLGTAALAARKYGLPTLPSFRKKKKKKQALNIKLLLRLTQANHVVE